MAFLKRQSPARLAIAALALAGVAFAAAPAIAALADPARKTPDNFSYDIKDGKRVPKAGKRVTNPDGSWREEAKDGDCKIVREKTASGEYRETRAC
jgi:hypothetical protein